MKTRNALLLVGGGAALAWAVWAPVVGQRGSSPAASVGVADPALDRAPAVAPGAAGPVAQATQPAAADLSDPPPPAAEVLVQVQAAGAHTSDRAVWDAARRLQAQPALADDLAELVLTPGTLPGGRALAMDLLAQSGQPQAQRALVRVLQDPRLAQRADAAERSLLVQRIGMVPQPLPETVDQAVALATAQDPVVRRAALAAAGGLARRLAVGGDPAGAEALLDRAVRPAPTEDVEDAAARLLGLGNAGRVADRDALLQGAADPRAAVRRASARGLGSHPGEQVTAALGRLAADDDVAVQRAALLGLAGRAEVSEAVLAPLAAAVAEGRVARLNQPLLVNALAPHAARPSGRRALEATLRAADDDARLRGRIRSLLQ